MGGKRCVLSDSAGVQTTGTTSVTLTHRAEVGTSY